MPVVAACLFVYGSIAAAFTLMFGLTSHLFDGVGCIENQPTLGWWDWWNQWTRPGTHTQEGVGIIYPKGMVMTNPWVICMCVTMYVCWCAAIIRCAQPLPTIDGPTIPPAHPSPHTTPTLHVPNHTKIERATELNITYDDTTRPLWRGGAQDEQIQQYDEFMRHHFELDRTCSMFMHTNYNMFVWPYWIVNVCSLLWVLLCVPTRNLFNNWSGDRAMPLIANSKIRTVVSFLGCFSFYACGPLASAKVFTWYMRMRTTLCALILFHIYRFMIPTILLITDYTSIGS